MVRLLVYWFNNKIIDSIQFDKLFKKVFDVEIIHQNTLVTYLPIT